MKKIRSKAKTHDVIGKAFVSVTGCFSQLCLFILCYIKIHAGGEMASRWEKIKETIILTLLSVILPTVDVYSDGGLVFVFYRGSRENPYCYQEYRARRISWRELWNCHYNDSVPTSSVTYSSYYE